MDDTKDKELEARILRLKEEASVLRVGLKLLWNRGLREPKDEHAQWLIGRTLELAEEVRTGKVKED